MYIFFINRVKSKIIIRLAYVFIIIHMVNYGNNTLGIKLAHFCD